MKTVLIIGSGGREHALAWKLNQSPQVNRIIVSPGNDGMPSSWERWGTAPHAQDSFIQLAQRASAEKVDLAVIGPDNPLAEGIVDVFEQFGILTFGPHAQAAQIEASKSFAKSVMTAAQVPTARYQVAESVSTAHEILKSLPWNFSKESGQGWVIKADGLAFGKGVRVCSDLEDALQAATELFPFSKKLIIEEKLVGEELSWMAFCDGKQCSLLEPARDYKRLLDSDQGPNTGGMGAVSPVPGVLDEWSQKIRESVFLPVLKEMKQRGCEFRGLLYAGLMVNFQTGKFWVLEFNSRLGDPESQVLLPRIEGDLLPWLEAVAQGDLSQFPDQVPFKKGYAVYVVLAAAGYPERPEIGQPIQIPAVASESLFFGGVQKQGAGLVTAGGRVLGALGEGATWEIARGRAYENAKQVTFSGAQYRTDIGKLG
jgi:phosphoribosylamine--glycine ligase